MATNDTSAQERDVENPLQSHCTDCGEPLAYDWESCWSCGAIKAATHLFADRPVAIVFRIPPVSWLRRLPHGLIAIACFGVLWLVLRAIGLRPSFTSSELVFASLGATLFAAGAIRRANGRQLLALVAVGAIAPYLADWAATTWLPRNAQFPWYIVWPTILISLAGASEWYFAGKNCLAGLVWMLIICLSAGLGVSVAFITLWHTHWFDRNTATDLAMAAMFGAAWLVIPWGHRLAYTPSRKLQVVSFSMAIVLPLACLGFFQSGVYVLARTSFHWGGPFSKVTAVELLGGRNLPADREFLLARLEEADWSEQAEIPVQEYGDWRATAIETLVRHDRVWAADRLVVLLSRRPSGILIALTRGLFVEQHRYDTVPITMRYALLESMSPSPFAVIGRDKHKRALEQLAIPQVTQAMMLDAMNHVVMYELIRADEQGHEPEISSEMLQIGEDLRGRMAKLLHDDAGQQLDDWQELYERCIDSVPTPLSPELHEETSRVVSAFLRYHQAHGKLNEWIGPNQKTELPSSPRVPDWNAATTTELEREVERFVEEVNSLVDTRRT